MSARRAMSLRDSSAWSSSNARITASPRASDCTKSGDGAASVMRTPPRGCLPFEDDRESLADADADRGDRDARAAACELVGGVADDATAGCTKGVPDRERAAVDVDLLGVEALPPGDVGERLRRERLVELD